MNITAHYRPHYSTAGAVMWPIKKAM